MSIGDTISLQEFYQAKNKESSFKSGEYAIYWEDKSNEVIYYVLPLVEKSNRNNLKDSDVIIIWYNDQNSAIEMSMFQKATCLIEIRPLGKGLFSVSEKTSDKKYVKFFERIILPRHLVGPVVRVAALLMDLQRPRKENSVLIDAKIWSDITNGNPISSVLECKDN
ncbi:hypothetical protein GPJ56_007275 [Histomonas meleagridis]|uniref:uncharacterized protein n=1 Tax=Histomonas meleagridis TaxID=135588 RepID=UPI00355A0ECE|nr:hypothetical protein GPJ56_007275 [Histomonas meleagridis]KAH0804121.1 hypothetical protein GO595_002951 [Histomonas meleagridis]